MEWDDLKVFLQVARFGHMTGAAQSLGVDHSTISRRVARLEQRVGVALFERAGRRLRITADGVKLRSSVEKLESVILRDVMNLSRSDLDFSGRVRVGTSEGLGVHYLARRIPEIMRPYPNIEVELVALQRHYSLSSREVDIAIVMERPRSGSIRVKKLTEYQLGVYCSKEYAKHRPPPEAVSDFTNHLWCGYIRDLLYTSELDMMAFGEVLVEPTYRTTSVTAQLEAIRSEAVLGILPCFLADQHADLSPILSNEVKIQRTYWLSVHEDLANVSRVRTIMRAIERQVRLDRSLFIVG